MASYALEVKGMHCKSCVMLVKDALEEIGASNVKVTVDEKNKKGKAIFDFLGDKEKAIQAIKKEGYTV